MMGYKRRNRTFLPKKVCTPAQFIVLKAIFLTSNDNWKFCYWLLWGFDFVVILIKKKESRVLIDFHQFSIENIQLFKIEKAYQFFFTAKGTKKSGLLRKQKKVGKISYQAATWNKRRVDNKRVGKYFANIGIASNERNKSSCCD